MAKPTGRDRSTRSQEATTKEKEELCAHYRQTISIYLFIFKQCLFTLPVLILSSLLRIQFWIPNISRNKKTYTEYILVTFTQAFLHNKNYINSETFWLLVGFGQSLTKIKQFHCIILKFFSFLQQNYVIADRDIMISFPLTERNEQTNESISGIQILTGTLLTNQTLTILLNRCPLPV